MVLSVSTSSQPEAASLLIDQIAHELDRDQHLIRIKKLLLYTCTGTWENDRHRLDRASMTALLQHLFEIAPSFEQLQQQINQCVASLNKSAEYTIVANLLISRCHTVYAQGQHPQSSNQTFYQSVAQRLEQEPEQVRIKKLLLLTCRSQWEGSLSNLEQLNMLNLVQELHQIAPTIEILQATLSQIAKTLSKPEVYSKIAEKISDLFQPLYQQETTDFLPKSTPVGSSAPLQTALLGSTERAIPTLLNLAPNATPSAPAKPPTAEPTQRPTVKVLTVVQPQKVGDLFDLRLQIMQDTNPLKAKILLFSLLHELFDWQTHDAMLKSHELDELLHILFVSYRLYSEAASKLSKMAQFLGADAYLQTAEAILRAIQPFYSEAQANPKVVPVIHATLTEITRMKADTSGITLPDHH